MAAAAALIVGADGAFVRPLPSASSGPSWRLYGHGKQRGGPSRSSSSDNAQPPEPPSPTTASLLEGALPIDVSDPTLFRGE